MPKYVSSQDPIKNLQDILNVLQERFPRFPMTYEFSNAGKLIYLEIEGISQGVFDALIGELQSRFPTAF